MTRRILSLLPATAALSLTWGCASVPRDAGVADVSRTVAERTGHVIAWQPGQPIEPPADAALDAALAGSELTVDRAVELALANNRDLLATLEELGIARADLIAARTVRNPLFEGEYHFPNQRFTPYEFAITQTLVDLIQLPRKRALGEAEMAAARLRVTASVVGFASEVRGDFFTLQAAQASLAQQQAVTAAAEAAAQLT
ncbi:MAG TPA: TolC family protein, partial [Thermoanaerobaculia bacterium]|nr:TolC family protein [Thermoanaerobaculia bacterium]